MSESPLLSGDDKVDAFDTIEDEFDRFEFAMYIVNTAPEDRPEVSEEDALEALDWLATQEQ